MGRPETGRTGARFGAPARRARHDPGTDQGRPVGEPEAAAEAETGAAVGLTGARFGGRTRTSRKERQAATQRAATQQARREPAEPPAAVDDARPTVEMPRAVEQRPVAITARPYVLTGGRTRVRAELRIETLVSATGSPAGESGERHAVITLCTRPRSVGEVAALTGVPLGVARVLIDDLATEGRLRVHLGVDQDGGPDLGLLDRVLSGLRRL